MATSGNKIAARGRLLPLVAYCGKNPTTFVRWGGTVKSCAVTVQSQWQRGRRQRWLPRARTLPPDDGLPSRVCAQRLQLPALLVPGHAFPLLRIAGEIDSEQPECLVLFVQHRASDRFVIGQLARRVHRRVAARVQHEASRAIDQAGASQHQRNEHLALEAVERAQARPAPPPGVPEGPPPGPPTGGGAPPTPRT